MRGRGWGGRPQEDPAARAGADIKDMKGRNNMETLRTLLEWTEADHKEFCRKAEEGVRYYRNQDDILLTGAAAIEEVNGYLRKLGKNPLRSADNRISANWHRILTDQKVGYLFSYPPVFDCGDGESCAAGCTLAKKVSGALGDHFERVMKELAVSASNTGRGWLTYWYGRETPFGYWFIDPTQIRVVYDPESIRPKMKYLIRSYEAREADGVRRTRHEVWTDRDVTYYTAVAGRAPVPDESMGEGGVFPHHYGRIPFILFRNNASETGDLELYKSLVDAIDKLLSGFANDIDDLQEIIWVIRNYAGADSAYDYNEETGEEVRREINLLQEIKAKKLVKVDDDGGVDTLRGEIPFEARSRFLDILTEQLFIAAMAVNPNPERTGNATGTYVQFLYGLLELKAGLMETEFRPALCELIRAALRYLGENEEVKIEQIWTRNRPKNDLETVQMIAATPDGILSPETKTKSHPLVENWQIERERISANEKKIWEKLGTETLAHS